MKTLKNIGIGLLIFMGLLLILSFVLSKEVNVRKSYKFNAPKEYVFNLVNNVKTYPAWNAWITNDPMIDLTFNDKTIGQGAGYSWSSEQSGSGSMYYDKVIGMDSIMSTMRFDGMSDSNVNYYFERDGGEGLIEVVWAGWLAEIWLDGCVRLWLCSSGSALLSGGHRLLLCLGRPFHRLGCERHPSRWQSARPHRERWPRRFSDRL